MNKSKEPRELKLYVEMPASAMLLGDLLSALSGVGLDGSVEDDDSVFTIVVTRRGHE